MTSHDDIENKFISVFAFDYSFFLLDLPYPHLYQNTKIAKIKHILNIGSRIWDLNLKHRYVAIQAYITELLCNDNDQETLLYTLSQYCFRI
jgi:hypothetical protein